MTPRDQRHSFSVDIPGLLEALTEQFPEPLLCVRELIQNAADAGSQRIDVDVAFDASRNLFRLSVRDDGRGMSAQDVEAYLTIGFSDKDPNHYRGRFGVGKLSPYALGIVRMVVETSDGQHGHRIDFNSDGSGTIVPLAARPNGTVVRVYKACQREEAEQWAERTQALVSEQCGSLAIPLFVNGVPVNRHLALPTVYSVPVHGPAGDGVLGVCVEPVHVLMGGGIVLESGAPILGPDVSYILDSTKISPTLSRNAVRRDQAFEALLRSARAAMPSLRSQVAEQFRVRVERLRAEAPSVERSLDPNDRAALEWLRSQLLEPEEPTPDSVVRSAPVLETADGGLVSAEDLVAIIRREGRVPASRIPRPREELAAYADRGLPVLLLYRDLEDFLERQAIQTVEVDELEDGIEVAEGQWGKGELALAARAPLRVSSRQGGRSLAVAASLVTFLAAIVVFAGRGADPSAVDARPAPVAGHAQPERPGPDGSEDPGAGEPLDDPASSAPVPAVERPGPPRSGRFLVWVAGFVSIVSAALGLHLMRRSLMGASSGTGSWLRAEAGAPLTVGGNRSKRWNVLSRAMLNPIDFFVARGWSARAAGAKPLSASSGIKGYREFAPEAPIRSGVRLDLDRVRLGFVDLVSTTGDPHDGRILLRRADRVLLNRNHPTVRHLIHIAERDVPRARLLLDVLLATDPELARGTDPRQVEWDLLGRSEAGARSGAVS